MPRILVTGAGGFIGARTAQHFSKAAQVFALVRPGGNQCRLRSSFPNGPVGNLKVIPANILDFPALKKICKEVRPDYIFHFAAYGNQAEHYSGKTQSERLREIAEINLMGMTNLLAALEDVPFKLFVNSGSAFAEYGSGNKKFKETQVCAPRTLYGITKAAASMLAEGYGLVSGKKILTTRLSYVYGPGEGLDRVIPTVIEHARKGTVLPLTSLKEKKDFIYIEDVLTAFSKLVSMKRPPTGVMNIGSSIESTLGDVIRIVQKELKTKVCYQEGAYKALSWPGQCWAVDIARARKLLNWKPRVSLNQGIKNSL